MTGRFYRDKMECERVRRRDKDRRAGSYGHEISPAAHNNVNKSLEKRSLLCCLPPPVAASD